MIESTTIAFIVAAATLVFAVGFWLERRRRLRFESKWPVISDDEFVAACSAGTSRDTALRVRRIVAEQLGVPYERIHPDQDFFEDLDCC